MGKTSGDLHVKRKKESDTIVVGGLHKDDFEWASKQYEALDYVFTGFVLDFDYYHWKAIYEKRSTQPALW
jgi:hypothetical protein